MIHADLGPESTAFGRQVAVRAGTGDALEAKRLHHQILTALAEQPRSLLCDLAAVPTVSAELLQVMRAVARDQVDWPGTPVGVVTADPRLQGRVLRGAEDGLVVFGPTVSSVEALLSEIPPADHATLLLPPGLTAPRSARAFVARTCLQWHARAVTGHACLVASELVTNAVLRADTDARLIVSRTPGRLRIAVRYDGASGRPSERARERTGGQPGERATTDSRGVSSSGRGLLLVSSACRAWGMHPSADDANVVWAVLDDNT